MQAICALVPQEDGVPAKFKDQLWLAVEIPASYPEEASVDHIGFKVETGKLSMLDWPVHYSESIIFAVREAARECAGMPCIFSCMQACSDWFEALSAGVVEKGSEESILSSDDCVDPEALLTDEEIIEMATSAAAKVAALSLKGMPTSRSGLWKFKIGLVGKPSVGKSTLFNAITKSSAAAVGAFPFTTIEPNVGVGFYSSLAEGDNGKGAYHGRARNGGRLLPVIIKDELVWFQEPTKVAGKVISFLTILLIAMSSFTS